jgi:YesN/AraC family two-component response regulator
MAIYNILIVDDEELICKGLKSMIERSGLDEVGQVSYTTEPAKVQNMLEELNTNIIITDVRMPEVSGLDLIKNISRSNLNIKFIVLSGYDDFKYVKEAFKLGAFDYLLKPGSLLELKAIMEKVINTIKEEERNKLNQQNNTHKYMEAVLENRFNKVLVEIS